MSTADMLPQRLPVAAPEWPRLSAAPLAISQPRYRNFDYLRLFLAIEVVAGHLWAGLMRPGIFGSRFRRLRRSWDSAAF